MRNRQFEQALVRDFFFEQEHDALSIRYRHGWFRTAYVVFRSIFFSRRNAESLAEAIADNISVAIVVFDNEQRAVSEAPASIGIERILRLEMRALTIVREVLGPLTTCIELTRFLGQVLAVKGVAYLPRSSIPALGWLLYRTFHRILSTRSNVTVVTTNMVHATSVGVHWAARQTGHRTVFFEHATTPGLIMHHRGYELVYVRFGHTRELLVSKGFDRTQVRVLEDIPTPPPIPSGLEIRHVAICVNEYDSLRSIEDLFEILGPYDIDATLRVHDADTRFRKLLTLASDRRAAVSYARDTPIQAFLRRIDLVITGNSNVIADALIARKPVFYYWAGSAEMFDYFGFVRHYALPHARSRQEMASLIAHTFGSLDPC